jgi:hypothetical protein
MLERAIAVGIPESTSPGVVVVDERNGLKAVLLLEIRQSCHIEKSSRFYKVGQCFTQREVECARAVLSLCGPRIKLIPAAHKFPDCKIFLL